MLYARLSVMTCVTLLAATAAAHPVEMESLNHRETYVLRADESGKVPGKQLRGWNRFLRCHHTGRVHDMSKRLAQLLYQVSKHFEYKKILVVAGYRAPKIARKKGNPKSPHKKGLACDFRVDGIPNETVRDYVREAFEHVGVGYYPNAGFIHLDVRDGGNAFWVDLSGPGERAQYSRDPEGEIREEDAAERAAAVFLPEPEGGADEE